MSQRLTIIKTGETTISVAVDHQVVWTGSLGEWSFAIANLHLRPEPPRIQAAAGTIDDPLFSAV